MSIVCRPSSLCILPIVVALCITLRVSNAEKCEDSDVGDLHSSTKDSSKYCCKIKRYIDREEKSQFYCSDGCCGDKNEERCCHPISAEEWGYIIGFSVFGLVVVVVVGVILFFVFRYVCRQYKEQKQHREQLEVYSAQVMNDLMEEGEDPPIASPPGTIVHPMVSDQGPRHDMRADPGTSAAEVHS